MSAELIPALDPAPLPGPPWLFEVLWVVTFLVHLLFVNAALGGSLLAALGGGGAGRRETRALLVEVNSWAISGAITFGIAPLLFTQVVLGRFFYSATILVAWAWFGMLGLLTFGYYMNYVAKFRLRAGREASAALWLSALCFLGIATIQVVINLLHMQPERWSSVAASARAALADPTLLPRLAHFLLAALAMSGALVAWVAVRRAARSRRSPELDGMARFGVKVALLTTVLQLMDGFWLLLALPEEVLRAFMRGGAATMVPLTVGILAGIGLLVVLAQLSDPLAQATKVRRVAELMVGAIAVMVVTRHQLRGLYLADARAGETLVVAPQWALLVAFLVVFVVGVALTAHALRQAAVDRPGPGERAA